MSFLKKRIFVAGHTGLVGSAIWRLLEARGAENLIGISSKNLDLRNQIEVADFFKIHKPEIVINAAAKVGGILANNAFPYEFLMDNLQIQNNLIDTSFKSNAERFLFLGSSSVYPKKADLPIREEYLMTGPLEPTNEAYAIAKISGIKACQAIFYKTGRAFFSIMSSNLYGPFDNFDLNSSHVIPAMIRKFHDSKIYGNQPVKLWGTGEPLREFLHVEDLADAVLFLLDKPVEKPWLNVGTGFDIQIKKLASMVQSVVGHEGDILWDLDKPDGSPRKVLDTSKINGMGWKHRLSLIEGITQTYHWYLKNQNSIKQVKMGI